MPELSMAPHGRGAARNIKSRYARFDIEAFEEDGADPAPNPRTMLIPEPAKSIVARNDSPDIPFDRSVNPYRGCEHGCSYCFARPSHAYLEMSPGLDFETKIIFKPNAADLLQRELAKKGYVCRPLALGSNTDPYQPAERRLMLTRRILEVLRDHAHPVTIVTKSALVLRDLDVLGSMAAQRLATVHFSITTLDPELARKMEPRAASPTRRLDAIRAVSDAGIPVGVMASPMIPGLNDAELETILESAVGAGATLAAYLLIRLPHEVQPLFVEWLERSYPTKAGKVLSQIREMRGGSLNDARFGERHVGQGPYAELLKRRFEIACKRLGLDAARPQLDTSRFRIPPGPGQQGTLFG